MNQNTFRVKNGVIALLFSSAGQSIIQIVVLGILARLVVPEAFGILALSLAVGDLVRVFARFGVSQSLIQMKIIDNSHLNTAFILSLFFGFSLSFIIYNLSDFIAGLLNVGEISQVLKVMALIFPFVSVSIVSESLIYRSLEFKKLALSRLISYVIGYVFIGLPLAFYGCGYWSLVFSYIIQQLSLAIFFFVIRPFLPKFNFDFSKARSMLNFGFGYSIGQIATILALRIDSFLVSRFLGPIALSLYDRSYQLMRFPAFTLATIVDDTMFPVMSQCQDDLEKLRDAFLKGLGMLAIILLPVSVVLFISSDVVIGVLLGEQWVDAIPIFQVLSSVIFFRSAQRIGTATLRALGMVYVSALLQLLYFITIVLAVYFGSMKDIQLVSYFVAFSIVFNFLLVTVVSGFYIDMKPMQIIRPIVASFPLSLACGILSVLCFQIGVYYEIGVFFMAAVIFLVVTGFSLFLIKIYPSVFLGRYGLWAINLVREKI